MNRIKFIPDDIYGFLLLFDDSTVARIIGTLELLDEFGPHLGPPKSKKISENLYELRVLGSNSIRILYTFRSNSIFILHAFTKKSRKIPPKELKVAINRLKYLR